MSKAIDVEGLGKQYTLGSASKRPETFAQMLKEYAMSPITNYKKIRGLTKNEGLNDNTFWAIKDLNFSIDPGDVVGVIGRNGAGKSTLLKILSRITEPTVGQVRIHGRIASLLEVGTGFHPELTGRDNVYMNGTILGMRKIEIDAKFEEIVEFSGVSKFIDTPVKFYSSGMKVRLGFAVAAHLEPEILIIDEVLAVGDAEFQKKCLGKMKDISGEGRTVLFVSHNISAIKSLTKNAIFLEGGRLRSYSSTEQAVLDYMSSRRLGSSGQWENRSILGMPIDVIQVKILNSQFEVNNSLDASRKFFVEVTYEVREWNSQSVIALIFHARDESLLFSTEETDIGGKEIRKDPGIYTSLIEVPSFLLNQGEYYIRLSYGQRNRATYLNEDILDFSLIHTDESTMRSYKKGAYFNPRLEWKTRIG